MNKRNAVVSALIALLGLALPTVASAAQSGGAVVFSKTTSVEGVEKGGLFAVRDGRLNQLTEDPADVEPAFSPDGTEIAFVREGDLYSVRPDGSGQRHLTSGSAIDSRPVVSANGRYVVFERRATEAAPADLWTVAISGGGLHQLTTGGGDDREAAVSPDGKAVVFVRSLPGGESGEEDDLFSVRPNGTGLTRLTSTATIDEFAPRYFAGGILFSRGDDSATPAAYADIYTMKRSGSRVMPQVKGVGSAYVEDVSPDGHTLLFRRDQGLWAKRIGPARAHKLAELPDGSHTTSVFSSDGRRVAAIVAAEGEQELVSIDVASGRRTELAAGYDLAEGGSQIGPVIDWQPTRRF
ncbi:MAG: PD40 domain-containing protein [Actinobacteria bacterium]|nr:PD40 domain-containing protein [Actinomycetota bacterium]